MSHVGDLKVSVCAFTYMSTCVWRLKEQFRLFEVGLCEVPIVSQYISNSEQRFTHPQLGEAEGITSTEAKQWTAVNNNINTTLLYNQTTFCDLKG